MKLITKTSLNFLSISIFVFLFGIVGFYYLLRDQVNQNINQELELKVEQMISQINSAHSSEKIEVKQNEKIIFRQIKATDLVQKGFGDTIIFDQQKKSYEYYRYYGHVLNWNNNLYFIQILKPLREFDNLIVRMTLATTGLILLISFVLLFMNWKTSVQAWKVFYNTVDKIQDYNVRSGKKLELEDSDIKEFDDLNKVLTSMTDRIEKDYLNIKEYTENASHEFQTPLAIINSKMENLLQDESLPEKQLHAIADAYEASNRLSRINKTLLLLSRIENLQYPEKEEVKLKDIMEYQLNAVEDLIDAKDLKLVKNINETQVSMNPYLADVLFLNLLKNAISHNVEGGSINIDLNANYFSVSNSGISQAIDPSHLFKRFHKASKSPDSTGLGLAIAHKICEVSSFKIDYYYENDLHHFKVVFNS